MEKRRIQKGRVDDLVLVEQVSEDAILETLKKRFDTKDIYTYIGQVLLSVNPFRMISNLYGEDVIQSYDGKMAYEMPPHVYAIAENAYRSLRRSGENQCILVSGESGAGKTEAAKRLLEYIVAVSGSGKDQRVKDALLNSNPVLESFGNAKTIRNDNSSRFGKYMEIQFNAEGTPVAGKLSNYLLETPRVVCQAEGENNYHIFYILLSGLSGEEKARLFLPPKCDAAAFKFLGGNDQESSRQVERFPTTLAQLKSSMQTIGLSEEQQEDLFKTCAAILWLGNIEFEEDHQVGKNSGRTGSSIHTSSDSQSALKNASALLGVSSKALSKVLVERKIVTNGESMDRVLAKNEASKTRDALAKALYGRIFQKLVGWINEAIKDPSAEDKYSYNRYASDPAMVDSIGVLDIYGFEIFQTNSFEQLCINYCNEKLHQLFIELTLRAEQDEYAAENIPWEHIEFVNNKPVCDLIEQRARKSPGILALLDEECSLLGKVDDTTLVKKLDKNHRDHSHYVEVKTSPDHFIIKHYAGDVKYTATGFLDKNKDTLFRDLVETLGESRSEFIKSLFPEAKEKRDQKKPPTAATQFKTQMLELVEALQKCNPSYIRCIKSNDNKEPGLFDLERCREQVRYLGILENVKVRRLGYAHRMPIEEFAIKYKMLSKATWPRGTGDHRTDTKHIMDAINCDEEGYTFGISKVFVRKPMTLFALEETREAKLHTLATSIQVCFRQYKARKILKELREKAINLFNNSKRRGASFRFYFCGDYIHARENPALCKAVGNQQILFADTITKIARDCKALTRLCVITCQAVYLFKTKKKGKAHVFAGPAKRSKFLLSDLNKATLSSFADGFVSLEVKGGAEASIFLYTRRKAEVITLLKEHNPQLAVEFSDKFEYVSNKPSTFFMSSSALEKKAIVFEESMNEKNLPVPRWTFENKGDHPMLKIFLAPTLGSKALIQPTVERPGVGGGTVSATRSNAAA